MFIGCFSARSPRQSLVGVLLGLLAIALVGCGAATPTAEPETIVFVHHRGETEHYTTLVEMFTERYPHITVELRDIWTEDADVFVELPYSLNQRKDRGEILNLDPYLETDEAFDLNDFYPGTVEVFTSEGKVWAIPAGADTAMTYYNRDLFDQYNAPYPEPGWTWDDFLSAALAIRDPEADVFGYAILQRANSFDPLLFIYQHGGRILDNLQSPTRTTFDDPLTVEALDWFVGLINGHNVAPTPQQTRAIFGSGREAIFRAILESKVGMWMGWFSERGGLTWPVDWTMRWAMLPPPRDAQSVTAALVEAYYIAADTEHPDAAWKWITFLSEQMPYSLVPAHRSVAESAAFAGRVSADVATAAQAAMEKAILISPELAEFGGALATFNQALDDIINGRATPEEALSRAQRQSENQ